ncbi:hypothetical protein FPV67DRAFT_1664364 [Lyophyllum atratum]|nr:hypothetical protein FPV67DRAFT_1664364 [Lyophyllum atratum]
MQMVIKEENAERKSGRKKQMSEGRKRQLNLGGFGPAKQKAMETQGTVSVMQLLKGTGPRKGKKDEGHLTPGGLNKLIVLAVDHQNQQVTRGKVDEWERRGGKIRSGEEGGSSYIGMDVDLDENDGSDEDWEPGQDIEERGSASPSPQPVDSGDEDDEGGDNQIEYDDADITMVHEEDSTPRTDDEHLVPVKLPSRRSKNKHIVVSDSEGGR